MGRDITKEEQYLLNTRESMQRLFASPDGKIVLDFIKSMTCEGLSLPSKYLEKAEGARRVRCMITSMMKDTPDLQFLQHCKNHYEGDAFFE